MSKEKPKVFRKRDDGTYTYRNLIPLEDTGASTGKIEIGESNPIEQDLIGHLYDPKRVLEPLKINLQTALKAPLDDYTSESITGVLKELIQLETLYERQSFKALALRMFYLGLEVQKINFLPIERLTVEELREDEMKRDNLAQARSYRKSPHDWEAVAKHEERLSNSGVSHRDWAGIIKNSHGVPESSYRRWRKNHSKFK